MNVQETSFQYERLDTETRFETEVRATRKWPINVIEKTSPVSLTCTLVPAQYRGYENGPFRTDSSADKSFQPAPVLNQFRRLRGGTEIATCQTTRVDRKDGTICYKSYLSKNKRCVPQ